MTPFTTSGMATTKPYSAAVAAQLPNPFSSVAVWAQPCSTTIRARLPLRTLSLPPIGASGVKSHVRLPAMVSWLGPKPAKAGADAASAQAVRISHAGPGRLAIAATPLVDPI
jgi:hypothetical protein